MDVGVLRRLSAHASAVAVAGVVVACTSASSQAGDTTSTSAIATPTSQSQPSATPSSNRETSTVRIRLTIDGAAATARLYDNATARDFAALLPLTITLHDQGGREMAGPLPRELTAGDGQSGFRAGQLGYWSPSRDLAVYYREDGFVIPAPGIVMIGEIESGANIVGDADDGTRMIIENAADRTVIRV